MLLKIADEVVVVPFKSCSSPTSKFNGHMQRTEEFVLVIRAYLW